MPFVAHMLSRALLDIQRYWYIVLITQAIALLRQYRERELLVATGSATGHAQLDVLKIQLEPHFLFNTLNSIAALARNDGPAAENMTLQLADLLRVSLDAVGVHEVTLAGIVVPAKVHRHSADALSRPFAGGDGRRPRTPLALVPNLLLQPLVENAIRHGIGPRREPGLIRFTCRQISDDLGSRSATTVGAARYPWHSPWKALDCATRAPGSTAL